MIAGELLDVHEIESFTFKWPTGTEDFEGGWSYRLKVVGQIHNVRHALGSRPVYGRQRVHTVTWLDGNVEVEGAEADDYPTTLALISELRHVDKTLVRQREDVPAEYDGFDIVDHRREIDAKFSRYAVAVKIREDDLLSWAIHAWLRNQSRVARQARPTSAPTRVLRPISLPAAPPLEKRAVSEAILAHGRGLAQALGGGNARFTPDDDANKLIHDDPFAFLVGVVCDQGIVAERAWGIPYLLAQRLGTLVPAQLRTRRTEVLAAFAEPPKLHRFVNQVAGWVVDAAHIVVETYGGDAATIWSDSPAAAILRARFDAFPGIAQKKAAMAVEILERSLGVTVADLSGSDVAYDVHLRRVFMRTGLAEYDGIDHMIAVARSLHPQRPGELDNPTWDIGRGWCHPRNPDCATCPLMPVCPRFIERGDRVKGI
jgi:uncharacterized HhH-GPD family protein